MARSFPPDVVVLENESLLHARFGRGKQQPTIVQAKSYRLAGDTFAPSMVTPELVSEPALAEVLRRLRAETGKWERVSLLLPDSWFRMNMLDLPSFNERQNDSAEVVRWTLKRTLPIPPEELRMSFEVISRSATNVSVLVVSAMEKALAALESTFGAAGMEVALIEPIGLNLWNTIAVRENGNGGDRLFVYVREGEFTTAVFRGPQPLFLRSRNLSKDRSLHQEIRLSASYLRDSLRTESFAKCYVAGTGAAEAAAALASEFDSPVTTVALRDFVEEVPAGLGQYDAELTACTGVFTG